MKNEDIVEFQDTEEMRAGRLDALTTRFDSAAAAIVLDDTYRAFMTRVMGAFNEEIGKLPPEQTVNGVLYVLRGAIANLEVMEDSFIEQTAFMAMLNGVAMTTNGRPGCDCPACRAARVANANSAGTRH